MRLPLIFALATTALATTASAQGSGAFQVSETGRSYARLTDAVAAIADGQGTILIAPGTYRECAVQTAGHVSYRAQVAGQTIFDGGICEGKAALVLRGRSAAVDGIVFQSMAVPDGNGAGIRLEKGNLDVTRSVFRNSEQGILTAEDPAGEIIIDQSTFTGLGRCDRGLSCAHSIYVGDYGSLTVTRSRFERGNGGHYVKSRAARAIIQNEMGKLDKASSSAPFLRLKGKIEEMKADPRYNFMFSGMLVGDTMGDFISKIFRLPSMGKPISIIDVSGVPSDITATVVAVLSRMVFDFAIWSRNEPQRPILLVCEEAHRYIPSDRVAGDSAVRTILERIAKEGRKYGVSLGLITQRPSDLAEGVLSQCGTIISMRLNNDRDQAFVRAAMPEGARGFLDAIPALRNRECIICGEGVSIPIRVALDTLEEEKRPASEDPLFSVLWQETGGEEQMLERVVRRWRSQGR